jgi:hypothetical protein
MTNLVIIPNKKPEELYNTDAIFKHYRKMKSAEDKLTKGLDAYEHMLDDAEAELTSNELNIILEMNQGGDYEKKRNRVSRFRSVMKL